MGYICCLEMYQVGKYQRGEKEPWIPKKTNDQE